MFRLYYTFSAEEMLANTIHQFFLSLHSFFKKNLVDTKRKCLSVFLLTIYCPLAAESSLSTFLHISLLSISSKFKATG